MIDDIYHAAIQRKNVFTAADLAADLGVDTAAVVKELRTLSSVGAAESENGKWRLTKRKTEARDELVHVSLRKLGEVPRADLNDALSDHTSAQVYTSLQRLILTGRAKQTRDGSRTPRYVAA